MRKLCTHWLWRTNDIVNAGTLRFSQTCHTSSSGRRRDASHIISTCSLEQPYRHFNISANLPFVNVRDSKLVVKEIGTDEGDLGLLRFIKERTIHQILN